jgi:3-isopropylmalate dehydrogenase
MTIQRWNAFINGRPISESQTKRDYLVGALEGEGIGSDLIRISLSTLQALEFTGLWKFQVSVYPFEKMNLPDPVKATFDHDVFSFCQDIFSQNGAILAGPVSGRFVYDLRKRFDLFCKVAHVRVFEEIIHASRMKPDFIRNVDMVLIRENASGVYQGEWDERSTFEQGRIAYHKFSYSEKEALRILSVGAKIARHRKGSAFVVIKDGGVPAISKLWSDCAKQTALKYNVNLITLNADYAAYRLLNYAQEIDVLIAPNLFGDILVDISDVLIGSRGLSCSGNFSSGVEAVYQTNHGAAIELVGKDSANPVGQIFALAILLRESFGLFDAADLIEKAVRRVWRQGYRTFDIAEQGRRYATRSPKQTERTRYGATPPFHIERTFLGVL